MLQFLKNILHRLLGKDLDDKIRSYFLKGSFKSLFLQSALSLLTFLTTIVVAQLTGDKGFGIYSLVFTWVSIVSVAATMGLDDLVLKQLPILASKNDEKGIKSIIGWAHKRAIMAGFVVTVMYVLLTYYSGIPGLSDYAEFHYWGALSIPFFVLMHLNQASMRGLGKLGQGQLAEKVVQPLFFLLLLLFVFILGWKITDREAIIFRALSFTVAALLAFWLLYKTIRKYISEKVAPEKGKLWLKSCVFFTLSSLLYIINTRIDIVFLGIYQIAPEQIAYYNVALKFSDIALIPFLVVCTVTTPMFSSLYHQGKLKDLQLLYTKVTRLTTFIISIILILFIALGPWLLTWYGKSFQAGYPVLVLLCFTKFVHVFVGPAGYLLAMIGQERAVTKALLISVLITIILQIILVPLFEIMGAAYATLGGLFVFDIVVGWVAYKKTGILVTAIGKFLSKQTRNP